MHVISPFYRGGIKAERTLVCCLRTVEGATSNLVNLELLDLQVPEREQSRGNTTNISDEIGLVAIEHI